MELDSEYFVIGDTAHTALEIEVVPMTLKGIISCLILLARCPQPPSYLVMGQILAWAIPVPKEITADGKSPEVYWAEVVGEDKPSLACNLTHGSDHLHVEGVLDTGADVMIIPERMWPSHWELQPVAGKIQEDTPWFAFSVPPISREAPMKRYHWKEDKVQRMPPWKYLGLEITARIIVPQKLEINCNPKTLADLHSLCGFLNWVRPWLGLINEDLEPLFNLLKGERELVSPRKLTPEVKAAIEKVLLTSSGLWEMNNADKDKGHSQTVQHEQDDNLDRAHLEVEWEVASHNVFVLANHFCPVDTRCFFIYWDLHWNGNCLSDDLPFGLIEGWLRAVCQENEVLLTSSGLWEMNNANKDKDAHVLRSRAYEEHRNNKQVDQAAKTEVSKVDLDWQHEGELFLVRWAHDASGHHGRDATYKWARDRGLDLTMDNISQVIHDCETCGAIKQTKRVKPLWTGPEVKNVLYSAAKNHGLSWSLSQKVPRETRGRPLGFWHQTYRGSAGNYTPIEKEILAAYEGVRDASEVIGTEAQLLLAP
ncbi:hypothetical protein TURU_063024 [Turdus rufiventris]|nr:hypothetical protein TURU_063024 [Turdus rufiventris]